MPLSSHNLLRFAVALAVCIALGRCTVFARQGPAADESSGALTFNLAYCGVGAFSSSNAYEASDGTVVTGTYTLWRSNSGAQKSFNRQLRQIPTVLHDSRLLDEGGKTIGRKVIGTATKQDGSTFVVVLTREGEWVTRRTAASLGHLQALHDWLQQHDPPAPKQAVQQARATERAHLRLTATFTVVARAR